jgi:hypothetical protein
MDCLADSADGITNPLIKLFRQICARQFQKPRPPITTFQFGWFQPNKDFPIADPRFRVRPGIIDRHPVPWCPVSGIAIANKISATLKITCVRCPFFIRISFQVHLRNNIRDGLVESLGG